VAASIVARRRCSSYRLNRPMCGGLARSSRLARRSTTNASRLRRHNVALGGVAGQRWCDRLDQAAQELALNSQQPGTNAS
jgi:hypothetical protein